MKKPDWKNEADYAFTESLSQEGWAWEFLRRNEDYRKSWIAFQKQAAEYELTLGYDWAKDRSTWRFDPPLLENEKVSDWYIRCRETILDFEELPFESYCAKQWGILRRMPDPDIPFPEQPESVRFLKPLEYPRLISDEIEFQSHAFQDEEMPYREVSRNISIIAFDLTRSIDRQLEEAKLKLLIQAKHLDKQQRDRRDPKAWPRYLRVLDAKATTSLSQIGKFFDLSPGESFQQNPEAQTASRLLDRARRWTRDYKAILIPPASKKKKSTPKA